MNAITRGICLWLLFYGTAQTTMARQLTDATVCFGRNETGAIDQLIRGRGDGAPSGRRLQ